jgi:protein-S-isoprenylcysteine O-methyltransferase Ste14
MHRFGALLFKWRSFTPLLLIPIALPLLWRSRGAAHPAWTVAGLALCLAGQALRTWVLGQVPDGTSGQNETLIATQLNTTGPYAHTRNPLYLGNLLITLGLCCVAHEAVLLAVVAVLFAVQYRAIIAAEERFLFEKFGPAFEEFRARVPRFWPSPAARAQGAARPFSWKRAIWKEHNPAASWLLLAIVLLAVDRAVQARGAGGPRGLQPDAIAFATVLVGWLAIKAWKHQWLRGGFVRDMKRRVRETAR